MIISDEIVNKYMQVIIATLSANDDLVRPAVYNRNLVILELYRNKLLALIVDQYNEANKTNVNIKDIC